MNKKNLLKTTLSLQNLNKDLTAEEREIINAEMKYYRVVVALKKQREKLGLTQEKLAERSNLPRTTINRIESGSRNATIATLMSMAQAMGKALELRLI